MIVIIVVLVLLLLIDCGQTLDIKNHPNLRERNVILGEHPKDLKVVVYFAVCFAFVFAYNALLEDDSSFILNCAISLLQLVVVLNNHKLGLRPVTPKIK